MRSSTSLSRSSLISFAVSGDLVVVIGNWTFPGAGQGDRAERAISILDATDCSGGRPKAVPGAARVPVRPTPNGEPMRYRGWTFRPPAPHFPRRRIREPAAQPTQGIEMIHRNLIRHLLPGLVLPGLIYLVVSRAAPVLIALAAASASSESATARQTRGTARVAPRSGQQAGSGAPCASPRARAPTSRRPVRTRTSPV